MVFSSRLTPCVCGVEVWIVRRVGILEYCREFPALVWTRAKYPAGIEGHLAAELGAAGGSGLLGVSFQPGCLTSTTKGPAPQGAPLQPFDAGSGIFCAKPRHPFLFL